VVLVLVVFAQVRHHEFVDLDDQLYVVNNEHVMTGLSAENVRWAFTTGWAANWHPLTWLSHQLDVTLFGMNASRHHLVNVGWHVINTLLLFGLLRAMTGAVWRSAFAAALFAVHPAHVESVAWISERKDVLSTCFWFLTTWAYVLWTRQGGVWRYGLTLVLLALGLMAKPMLMTLPFTLLLLDVWPLKRSDVSFRQRVIEKLPLFALVAASAAVTIIMQRGGGAVTASDIITLAQRLSNAVVSYAEYLRILVWPVDLAVFYPYVMHLTTGAVLGSAALLLIISLVAWRARRSQPALLTGWLWYLGTLVPVIGLLQVGLQAYADRYTYVPYVGLFIAIAWTGRDVARRVHMSSAFLRVVAAGIVVALAMVARYQTSMWVTSEAIWLRAVTSTTNNARAHNALGMIYGRAGNAEDAAFHFQEALRLRPDLTEARTVFPNLGQALMQQGHTEEAIPYLERGCQLNPERADLRHTLALAYFGANRTTDAIAAWQEAVRINPNFEDAHFMMGMVLAANNRIDEARRAFQQVLRINPGRADAANALAALGRRK
jgi:tetratricopeptide (TPR) repeat protein